MRKKPILISIAVIFLSFGLLLVACATANTKSTTTNVPPAEQEKNAEKQLEQKTTMQKTYDNTKLYDKDFDGSEKNDWVINDDKMCNNNTVRPIIVDVDKTAVNGNFIAHVEANETAIKTLSNLDKEYGIIFLSANFVVDRMVEFFREAGYPQTAPIISRPRNYWGKDYESWCSAEFSFGICESAFKIDRINYYRATCGTPPPRMIGLGDKFSDYYAYKMQDLCPIMVKEGGVDEANKKAGEAGCELQGETGWAFFKEGVKKGDRCPLIPEKYIMPWSEVEKATICYLKGECECGKWTKQN